MDCSQSGSSFMELSRQEHWSGLPCPPPRDLPNARTNPRLLNLLNWQTGSSPLVPPGKPHPLLVCQLLSCVRFFATSWIGAHQAPLSMGFPGKNTQMGCHSLFQGIFLTQGLNTGLLHWRQIIYHLNHQGKPSNCLQYAKYYSKLF